MIKHTPGPWLETVDGWIVSASGVDVIEYAGCGTHEAEYPNPADKALILAAPDLLAAAESALETAESVIRDYMEGSRGFPAAMAELEPVRRAIKQAKGEA